MKKWLTLLLTHGHLPYLQAGVVLSLACIAMLLAALCRASGVFSVSPLFYWQTAASFMLLFAIFNSIIGLTAENVDSYFNKSILSFIGLATLVGLAAYLFSQLGINEAGSYRWIYTVVFFGYLVFLSIMGFARRIVRFAEREEWNAPKPRQRK